MKLLHVKTSNLQVCRKDLFYVTLQNNHMIFFFQIEMAQKTLNSDLVHLIDAMKMVIRYSPTDLAQDYRRRMLQLGHALAIDAKTLLDTVDLGRKKKILSVGLANSRPVTVVANQISAISLQSDLHSTDQLNISQTGDAKLQIKQGIVAFMFLFMEISDVC